MSIPVLDGRCGLTQCAGADYSFGVIKPTSYATMLAAGLLLAATAAVSAQSAPDTTGTPATYTSAQASRGESVFRSTCGNCHSTSQFIGPAFDVVWRGRRIYEFFDQLRNTMPLDNPGGLSREEYAGVIAYILKLNAYPAGDEPLPDDDAALKQLRFLKP